MNDLEADELVKTHQELRYTDSPLPHTVGRMRLAYLTYINNKFARQEQFSQISMDDLLQGYIHLDDSLGHEPLSRFSEICDFITECENRHAEIHAEVK